MQENGETDRADESAAQAQRRAPRHARRERAAADVLHGLIRDLCFQRFGVAPTDNRPLHLSLRVDVDPAADWAVSFEPPLLEQLEPQLADARAVANAFRTGHVHCFRCASSDCAHSRPPSEQMVFAGYSSTGVPEWKSLTQVLLDAKDENVDRLYAHPPRAVTRVQTGKDLKTRQLASFGKASRTYAILGQVVSGYYFLRPRDGARKLPVAVTFQVVEARDADAGTVLRLNCIPAGLSLEEWEDAVLSERLAFLRDARAHAAGTIETMERQVRAARRENADAAGLRAIYRRVPRVLDALGRDLNRGGRRRARRTRHAEDRREARPVHKAIDDARAAAPRAVLYDLKRETWIVCGRAGRTHAFAADGRHVTSFVLPAGGTEFRVRTGRWRRTSEEEARTFLSALLGRADGS